MDYVCRLGSLGNSSTASGSSDGRRVVSYAVGTSFFVPSVLLSNKIFSKCIQSLLNQNTLHKYSRHMYIGVIIDRIFLQYVDV